MRRRHLLFIGCLLLSGIAHGQERPWPDEVATFGLASAPARVKPTVERTFFHRDGPDCSSRPTPACRKQTFVSAGDEVVVALAEANLPLVRAMYRAGPREPMVTGWLAVEDLLIDAEARPVRAAALEGNWAARVRSADNEAGLVVKNLGGGVLKLAAESRIVDAQGQESRGAPQRDFEGTARITSDPYVTLREERCVLRLVPAGRYLIVIDEEGLCADGGETLALSGLYLRAGPSSQ